MLQVLHVIGPMTAGGAQTQLLGLVRAAHEKHWHATVVGTSGGPLSREFTAVGCDYVELERRASPGLLRMHQLRRILTGSNVDVVHGNLWQSNAYCRIAVVARRHRPGVVISERNVEASRSLVKRTVDRSLAPLTDAYVGNTDAVTAFVREVHPIGKAEVLTIPNAVDSEIFAPRHGPRAHGPTRIGSVGRLDPEKGYDVLVEAVRVVASDMDIRVSVVGDGPELERLRTLATGLPISFIGTRPPGLGVAEFLRELDVFVLPSIFREGRPNAVLEAISTELPVVTTDIDGMREVFGGPTLVPPGDPVALALAIREAAIDPAAWRAKSAPYPVIDFDQLARRYLELFVRTKERARG